MLGGMALKRRWAQRLHALFVQEGWACDRGRLLTRPVGGGIKIVAGGRADWVGWVELKKEPVDCIVANPAVTELAPATSKWRVRMFTTSMSHDASVPNSWLHRPIRP